MFPTPQTPSRFTVADGAMAAQCLDMAKLLESARMPADLPLIEWDGDRSAAQRASEGTSQGVGAAGAFDDPKRRRIRDRYIEARFPGIASGVADLLDVDAVIKAARLLFEEERAELALELLDLAIAESPREPAFRLAALEILFLTRDRGGFIRAASAMRATCGMGEEWKEIEHLGRVVAPGELLFGDAGTPRAHEHYGPWPDLPNWIRAPWDLTADVLAADFHRAVRGPAASAATPNEA